MTDSVLLWVTIFGVIVIPVVGWVINQIITTKIDTLDTNQKEDKNLFFRKFDEIKEVYVRKEIYDQAMSFYQKETDTKFENVLSKMDDKFKAVEEKIEDIKELIIKNFNTQQRASGK